MAEKLLVLQSILVRAGPKTSHTTKNETILKQQKIGMAMYYSCPSKLDGEMLPIVAFSRSNNRRFYLQRR